MAAQTVARICGRARDEWGTDEKRMFEVIDEALIAALRVERSGISEYLRVRGHGDLADDIDEGSRV